MQRIAAIALAATALGCSAGSAVGGNESSSSERATLRIVKRAPLTVRGVGFRSNERVRVTATGRSWRLRATPSGTFVVVIGSGADRCSQVRVRAVGSGGTQVVKILPAPECAPAKRD